MKQKIFYFLTICISIFILFFVISCSWIGFEVKNQCQIAINKYGKDCVESLIMTLDNNNEAFKTRNDAVWALGQMGDRRALPTLKKYYTGKIPNREPLNKTISQYELKKAIKLVAGGYNITAIFWRN